MEEASNYDSDRSKEIMEQLSSFKSMKSKQKEKMSESMNTGENADSLSTIEVSASLNDSHHREVVKSSRRVGRRETRESALRLKGYNPPSNSSEIGTVVPRQQEEQTLPIAAEIAPGNDTINDQLKELRREFQERDDILQRELRQRDAQIVSAEAVVNIDGGGLTRRQNLLVLLAMVIAVIAVIVALAVGLSNSKSSPIESPTSNPILVTPMIPTSSPTSNPTTIPTLRPGLQMTATPITNPTTPNPTTMNPKTTLLTILSTVEPNLNTLDPLSPQYKAFQWMLTDEYTKLDMDTYLRSMLDQNDQNTLDLIRVQLIERYVVIVLYFSTNGEEWNDTHQFLSSKSHCEWKNGVVDIHGKEGISCNGDGLVTSINFDSNGLSGSLPTELGYLSKLRMLRLVFSNIYGPIPPELWKVTSLWSLWLTSNNLSGLLSSEISRMTNLRHFGIGINKFSGTIPTEVGNLMNLLALHLQFNDFVGTIPKEIGNLERLQILFLGPNVLTGQVPHELEKLTNLQWINLHENDLTGEINSIFCHGDVPSLKTLHTVKIDCSEVICSCCTNCSKR